MKKTLLILLILLLCSLCLTALAEEVPYRQRVSRPDEMIFAGPSYDEACVSTVYRVGVYTIVEEVDDGEGHLWGRLKSGAGWIDLTHVRSEEAAAMPVSAAFAVHCPPANACHAFWIAEDDTVSWLAFRAYETLSDVRVVTLDVTDEGYAVGETLYTLPLWTTDQPLLAGVVFYGDMTAYGLCCTDAQGMPRCFAATISGRNGMLILEEWPVIVGPDGAIVVTVAP